MIMATPNPLVNSHPNPPPAVSSKIFHIAGILTTVYGLEELNKGCKSISCLWLLHPRLATKQIMASVASTCINEWSQRRSSERNVGLIAVAFDQRNHGSREVTPLANEAWRSGNPTHAQDMFRYDLILVQTYLILIGRSIFHGTALDTSLLIDHLGSYIFHDVDGPIIDQHLVLGISLGGHAAWQVWFNDPRVTAAIVIIGCPDYMRKWTLLSAREQTTDMVCRCND